jgi:metal-responsive CopG/Arc/MetJ family transcriptional regulator
MSMCRRFNGQAVERVTVTLPAAMVAAIDRLLRDQVTHPAHGCRSEFIRLAVAEKVGRELMLSCEPTPGQRGKT